MYIPEIECPHCHSTATETLSVAGSDTGEFMCRACAHVFPLLDGLNADESLSMLDIEEAQQAFDRALEEERYALLFQEMDQQLLSAKAFA